jgi:hypothetical protein
MTECCERGVIRTRDDVRPPRGFVEIQRCDDCSISKTKPFFEDDVEAGQSVSSHVYYWHRRRGFMAPALAVSGIFRMLSVSDRVNGGFPDYLDWYSDPEPGAVRVVIPRHDAKKAGILSETDALNIDMAKEADVVIGLKTPIDADIMECITERVRRYYGIHQVGDRWSWGLIKIHIGVTLNRKFKVQTRYGSDETIRMIRSIVEEEL